jgi:hypothetical protein
MDCGIANAKEAEPLSGEFVHCLECHLEFVLPNHVLARFDFDGQDLALVPRL